MCKCKNNKIKNKNVTAVKKSKYIKVLKNDDKNSCFLNYEIDLEKMKEDKKYDGFYAIASSDTSIDALNRHFAP